MNGWIRIYSDFNTFEFYYKGRRIRSFAVVFPKGGNKRKSYPLSLSHIWFMSNGIILFSTFETDETYDCYITYITVSEEVVCKWLKKNKINFEDTDLVDNS